LRERPMTFRWTKAKPIPAPTDLELELVEALETVTECAEQEAVCPNAVEESREVLERAKTALGMAPRGGESRAGADRR